MKVSKGLVIRGNGIKVTKIPGLVVEGLTLHLDASNTSSYPGSGSTWYDLSNSGADVTLYNDPVFASGPPKRLDFNGSNQYGATAVTGLVPSTGYTKTAWFFWVDYGYNNNIVSGSNGGHFMFGSGQNKIYGGHSDWGNYTAFPSITTISLLTWYYVALTFNTTDGMALYINGVLDNTYTANKNAHPGDGSVEIAAYSGSNNMFGGISEVHCYNRSLTSGEILQNYNYTKGKFGY